MRIARGISAERAHLGSPCDDLQLCATELITNVIRHLGEGVPVTVRASCDQDRTRWEVTDPDPGTCPSSAGRPPPTRPAAASPCSMPLR